MSSRHEISQQGIEPPTSSFIFGYLSTTSGSLGSLWTIYMTLLLFSKFSVHPSSRLGDFNEELLYQFIESQFEFGMLRRSRLSLVPFKPIQNVLHLNLHTNSTVHRKLTEHEQYCMQHNHFPTKTLVELKEIIVVATSKP